MINNGKARLRQLGGGDWYGVISKSATSMLICCSYSYIRNLGKCLLYSVLLLRHFHLLYRKMRFLGNLSVRSYRTLDFVKCQKQMSYTSK